VKFIIDVVKKIPLTSPFEKGGKRGIKGCVYRFLLSKVSEENKFGRKNFVRRKRK